MTTKHLTDNEVQQYILDGAAVGKEIMGHVHSCEECRARAEIYRLLITGIEQQPVPVFDFDLQELVMSRLPLPAAKASPDNLPVWIFILPVILSAGLIIYFFRNYITTLLTGITSLFVYLAIISVAILLAVLCVDMYKTYREKMNSLDLY